MADDEQPTGIGPKLRSMFGRPGYRTGVVVQECRECHLWVEPVIRHHDDGAPRSEGQGHEGIHALVPPCASFPHKGTRPEARACRRQAACRCPAGVLAPRHRPTSRVTVTPCEGTVASQQSRGRAGRQQQGEQNDQNAWRHKHHTGIKGSGMQLLANAARV